MQCLHPFIHDGDWLPCGKCLPCRIRKKREWVARLNYELFTYEGRALFVTLTYRDEKLPLTSDGLPTLNKKDLQNFFKRLRKRLGKNHEKIKYFACGEYGSKMNALQRNSKWRSPEGRPHYHAIIFGVGLEDIPTIKDSWSLDDCADWRWNPVNKSAVGFVERDSIGYVAGYVQKKMDKRKGTKTTDILGMQNPFQLSSQGIGYRYIDAHADKILLTGRITDGKHLIGLPQTIKRHLGVDCRGYRLALHNENVRLYREQMEQYKLDFQSDDWKRKSKKMVYAQGLGVRGQAFCDYMNSVNEVSETVKTAFVESCRRKGVEVSEDFL